MENLPKLTIAHVATELLILGGLSFVFTRKINSQNKRIEELEKRLESLEKHGLPSFDGVTIDQYKQLEENTMEHISNIYGIIKKMQINQHPQHQSHQQNHQIHSKSQKLNSASEKSPLQNLVFQNTHLPPPPSQIISSSQEQKCKPHHRQSSSQPLFMQTFSPIASVLQMVTEQMPLDIPEQKYPIIIEEEKEIKEEELDRELEEEIKDLVDDKKKNEIEISEKNENERNIEIKNDSELIILSNDNPTTASSTSLSELEELSTFIPKKKGRKK